MAVVRRMLALSKRARAHAVLFFFLQKNSAVQLYWYFEVRYFKLKYSCITMVQLYNFSTLKYYRLLSLLNLVVSGKIYTARTISLDSRMIFDSDL